jgi:signal transduction histidine kinase/DNA-binding response OmpR family regulator
MKERAMSLEGPARILIVDDHEDNLALLRIVLESQGYQVVSASDGSQALDLVRRDPPDLLLLDVMMPRMSGYEVTQLLRKDESLPYIPIMQITAKQDLSDKVKGLDVGADDFLPKPVQSSELIAKVRALLRLKQAQDALISERNKIEMLYLVGQQLSSTLNVDQLISETLNLMVNLIGATQGSVIIKDSKRHTWRKIMARTPLGQSAELDGSSQVIAEGLAGLALRTQRPQLVTDTLHDDRWLPIYDDPMRVRTALSIPLVRDRIELGVLTLTHSEPNRFSDDQLPMVLAVAAQVNSALHNASLYTQLKEAEAAREYFVHMLTHDLRGPLAGILGCLHVLGMTTENETSVQFIDMARKACEAQEELINDILDVYKAESDGLELTKIFFKASELRGPVLDQLAGAAAERNLTLRIDLPDEPTLHGDVRKLIRVLINLVNNAIKFTRKGGITVDAVRPEHGSGLIFRVHDTGVGIAPADVPHVFDRFFQAQQPGARRGSGLGLNFCQVVVNAHGGQIWAQSELGAGTTILFSLPLSKGVTHEQMAHIDRG